MVTERTYIIPLRRHWLMVPHYRRAKKAISALQNFIVKHMKSEDVRIGKMLNEEVWARGMKNPPHKVKVTIIKEDDGLVKAELFGHKYTEVKKIAKEEKSSGLAGKLKSALKVSDDKKEEAEDKKEEKPVAEKKPVTAKPAEKKEAEKPAKKA